MAYVFLRQVCYFVFCFCWGSGVCEWASVRESWKRSLDIASAVKNAQDGYGFGSKLECDHGPLLEADNPEAGPKIVANDAPPREYRKILASILETVDIADSAVGTVAQGNVIV